MLHYMFCLLCSWEKCTQILAMARKPVLFPREGGKVVIHSVRALRACEWGPIRPLPECDDQAFR